MRSERTSRPPSPSSFRPDAPPLRPCAPNGAGGRAVAEREGFEPSRELAPPTRLAGECLQPLGHLSWDVSAAWPPGIDSRRGDIGGLPSRARAPGGVAEWLNAAALKAVDRFRRSGGSNPSPSALDRRPAPT